MDYMMGFRGGDDGFPWRRPWISVEATMTFRGICQGTPWKGLAGSSMEIVFIKIVFMNSCEVTTHYSIFISHVNVIYDKYLGGGTQHLELAPWVFMAFNICTLGVYGIMQSPPWENIQTCIELPVRTHWNILLSSCECHF